MSNSIPLQMAMLCNFVFLGPILWIQELLQNILTQAVTGDWGWIYPRSEHHWWSFHTMPSWGALAAAWLLLNVKVLEPRKMDIPTRLIIMAAVGWIIEYLNGFIQEHSGSEGLQVWPGSPLRYVTYGCYLWWLQNGVTWFALNSFLATAGSGALVMKPPTVEGKKEI